MPQLATLALNGGDPVRTRPYPKWPEWGDSEKTALAETLESGNWGGYPPPSPQAGKFESEFAAYHDADHGVAIGSGTSALMVALRAAGIGYGDEVIVPALTFVASASCVLLVGATPVFADVDPDTYCIRTTGPGSIEEVTTNRTRGVVPVHLGSRMADMSWISQYAEARDMVVVEDCAHMHGGAWDGKGVGSHGTFGAFSFQSSKLLTAGEGGLVTTSDPALAEKARYLVNSGRLGPGDAHNHDVLGWSLRMTEFQGALLRAQLQRMIDDQAPKRERHKALLSERLSGIEGIALLKADERETRRSGYAYIFKYLEDKHDGVPLATFTRALRAEGIPCSSDVYQPIYDNEVFPLDETGAPLYQPHLSGEVDYRDVHCPEAEKAARHENVWIFHEAFLGTEQDVHDIADAVEKVITNINELRS